MRDAKRISQLALSTLAAVREHRRDWPSKISLRLEDIQEDPRAPSKIDEPVELSIKMDRKRAIAVLEMLAEAFE